MSLNFFRASPFVIPSFVLMLAAIMIACETLRPGRQWPVVRGWWVRAFLLNSCQIAGVFAAGLLWDSWMRKHSLFSMQRLGTTASALFGYFVITFVFYWWHLLRHKSDFLWRWLHQIHHSPQRLEIITAFYKHPAEIMLDSVLSSALLYCLLGLTPIAAAEAVLLSGIGELFYHWNVKTPFWVGYIFQRPESHCIHHQKGIHAFNYSDLPLWDMLFGTFRNPAEWNSQCGFYPEAEARFSEMLIGVDVNHNLPGQQQHS
jgi:sterol desaturase/sphingolipid hydroxylase (fatty acid hydroxylase superfamily)